MLACHCPLLEILSKLGFFDFVIIGLLLLLFGRIRDFLDLVLHAFVEELRVTVTAVLVDHAILAEAQQNRINTNVVNGEDVGAYTESEDANDDDQRNNGEKCVVACEFVGVGKPHVCRDDTSHQHHKLAQEHHVAVDQIHGSDLQDVRGDEHHGHDGCLAEVVTIHSHHDVRLTSQKLEASLEEEKQAVDHFEESSDALVVFLSFAALSLKIHEEEAD